MDKYVVFANGVLDPTQFAANPEARNTAFELLVKDDGSEKHLHLKMLSSSYCTVLPMLLQLTLLQEMLLL